MPPKPPPETNPTVIKKLGATLRDETSDIVSEELPDEIKRLLERMRAGQPEPKK
jgi:hypothetical protein